MRILSNLEELKNTGELLPDTILNADCIPAMEYIKDKSVDMILSDIPYSTTSLSWDSLIPFDKLWGQYNRVIKDKGAIVLTASQPFTSKLVCSNLDMFKYEWIWCKNQGSNFASVKYQPMKEHESVLVFSKGSHNYYPIMQKRAKSAEKRLEYPITKYKGDKREILGGLKDNNKNMSYNKKERNPSSYQNFDVVPRHKGTLHPTQKPVKLFEYLIKTYTKEGEIVLDSCAGSFTAFVACDNLKRKCISIEKEEKYFYEGIKRINENRKEKSTNLFDF